MKALFALLLLTTAASAATKDKSPDCKPNTFDGKFIQTKLTIGQYHFLEGIWAVLPDTPAGLPPGDGAFMVYSKGGKPEDALIVITKGNLMCGLFPHPVGSTMLNLLRTIKDGPGEAL